MQRKLTVIVSADVVGYSGLTRRSIRCAATPRYQALVAKAEARIAAQPEDAE